MAAATLALTRVKGLGPTTIRRLLQDFGSGQAVWDAPSKAFERFAGLPRQLPQWLVQQREKAFREAKELLAEAARHQVQIWEYGSRFYPKPLLHIPDAPAILYAKGHASVHQLPRLLAIVGTRRATNYGKKSIEALIEQAPSAGFGVVSGLARGIDISALHMAREAQIPAIMVLPGGHATTSPVEHQPMQRYLEKEGLVISEYPPEVQVQATHYPARNRLIAGLAQAVFIPEAAQKSGAIITARLANDYNREVFALPGPISKNNQQGCHWLIQQHMAHLYSGPDFLYNEMGWKKLEQAMRPKIEVDWSTLDEAESKIARLLQENGQMHIEKLAAKLDSRPSALSPLLLQLELKSLVKTQPGGYYTWEAG